MPGQQNRTANSWGRRRVLERASERLMPSERSGAESVATVGAAHARALRTSPLLRFASSSPSLLSCLLLLLWYLPLPLFLCASRYAHLPLPSLSHRSPSLLSLVPPSVAAVARSGRWPRDHIVYMSHTLFTYICAHMQACTRIQPRIPSPPFLPAIAVVAALPRKIKLEL